MIGKLKDLLRGRNGEWILSFSTPSDPREMFDKLNGKTLDIDLKQHRKRRSLDANAYAWVLISKIAENQNISKTEVYRKEIRECGVCTTHCVPNNMLAEAITDWESFGLGFQTETFPVKTPNCTGVTFYKGSHFYDSKQMARLIDGLIHEAEGLGIATISPEEEKRMLGDWGKKRKENENGT